jgi:hypothetical protein
VAISLSSPVTGAAQTGFTSPTYTLTADIAPDNNGKQWAVTALGGTQVGVTAHSMSSPFTITHTRPKVVRSLGKPNPTTGLIANVPRNTFKVIVRKGTTPAVNQPYQTMLGTVSLDVPAGADTYDAPNVRALCSLLAGALWQVASGQGDTLVSNII